MNKILFIILFPLFLKSQVDDKLLHNIAGTAITVGTGEIMMQCFDLDFQSLPIALAAGIGSAFAKEVWDHFHGGIYNREDIIATIQGVATGMFCLVVHIDIDIKRWNKKMKKLEQRRVLNYNDL